MSVLLDAVSIVFIALGTMMAIVAAVGMFRLPGTTMRMHAATKPATLGVLACAIGAALQVGDAASVAKIAVIVVFQFITVPVGAHMLARAITREGTTEANE